MCDPLAPLCRLTSCVRQANPDAPAPAVRFARVLELQQQQAQGNRAAVRGTPQEMTAEQEAAMGQAVMAASSRAEEKVRRVLHKSITHNQHHHKAARRNDVHTDSGSSNARTIMPRRPPPRTTPPSCSTSTGAQGPCERSGRGHVGRRVGPPARHGPATHRGPRDGDRGVPRGGLSQGIGARARPERGAHGYGGELTIITKGTPSHACLMLFSGACSL